MVGKIERKNDRLYDLRLKELNYQLIKGQIL